MLAMNAELKIRLPACLAEALERAAQKEFSTVSEYTRQSLVARLRRDGISIASDSEGAA